MRSSIRPFPMDAARIRHVLLNLVANALSSPPIGIGAGPPATGDGRGEGCRGAGVQRAERTGAAEDAPLPLGSRLPAVRQVAVSDTGPGNRTEDQERIFQDSAGPASTWWGKTGGTGLGYDLARKFIEMHGGRIWVESKLGKGSTFTFALRSEPAS